MLSAVSFAVSKIIGRLLTMIPRTLAKRTVSLDLALPPCHAINSPKISSSSESRLGEAFADFFRPSPFSSPSSSSSSPSPSLSSSSSSFSSFSFSSFFLESDFFPVSPEFEFEEFLEPFVGFLLGAACTIMPSA